MKGRNGMDLTEAEDIKKRWQEYTKLYKKDIHDPDNHHGAEIPAFLGEEYLVPDTRLCEVSSALQ